MKKTKTIIAVFLSILIALISVGCGEETEVKNIIYDSINTIKSLDPQLADELFERELAFNLYEGLTRFDSDGELQLASADECKVSKDGITYKFHIADDAVWSNGTPVTAYDFEFGIKKAFTKGLDAPYLHTLSPIKNAKAVMDGKKPISSLGVKASDNKNLKIKLEYKFENFKELLATPICSPCNEKFFKNSKGYYGLDKKHVITNGNYYIDDWNDSYCTLKPKNKSNSTVYIYFNDYDKISEELKDGKTDYTVVPSSSLYNLKKSNIDIKTKIISDSVYTLLINKKSEFFNNDIIKAFMSTAKCNPNKEMLQYGVAKATSILPDIIEGSDKVQYSESVDKYRKKARNLFLDGCETLEIERTYPTVTITYIKDEITEEILKDVAESWQSKLGVTVNTTPIEDKDTLTEIIDSNEFDFCLIPITAPDTSPFNYLRQFTSKSPANYLGFKNSEYDKSIEKLGKISSKKYTKQIENTLKYLGDYQYKKILFTTSQVCCTPNDTKFSVNPKVKVTDYTSFK